MTSFSKKAKLSISLVIALLFLSGVYYFNLASVDEAPSDSSTSPEGGGAGDFFLTAMPGWSVELFADLKSESYPFPGPNNGPRLMTFFNNDLFVAVPSEGHVIVFRDLNSERGEVFLDGLQRPHDIEFKDGFAFIAEEDKVSRVRVEAGNAVRDSREVIVQGLPASGHWTKSILLRETDFLVTVGSSCNVCVEEDERRASVLACSYEGECEVFARGLRNVVELIEFEGDLYGTEMGRDWLGDDLPPDEIVLVERGKNYGWPYCYGSRINNPEYLEYDCTKTKPPVYEIEAHSAPIGLRFLEPEKLLVAYHGSWNSSVPKGYKVVLIDLSSGKEVDFLTGFISNGDVVGRPTGIEVVGDQVFVADDKAGNIYRVYK